MVILFKKKEKKEKKKKKRGANKYMRGLSCQPVPNFFSRKKKEERW